MLPRPSEAVVAAAAARPAFLARIPGIATLAQVRRAAAGAPWALYLTAALAVTAFHLGVGGAALTTRWVAICLGCAVMLSSGAAVLVGVHRNRPGLPRAWQVLAAAMLTSAAANLLRTLSSGTAAEGRGVLAGVSDVLHLAGYPLMMVALVLLIRRLDPGRNWPSVLDALVVATGAAFVSWVFLIDPLAREPGLALSERLVAVAHPVGDLLVLALAVRVAVSLAARTPAAYLLGVALATLLVSDSAYALARLSGDRFAGLPVEAGWMVSYAAIGAAALHPSMRRLCERPAGRGEAKLTTWRLVLLAGASLTAPFAVWMQWARGEPVWPPVFAISSAVLFLLVLARTGGLAREVAAQASARKMLLDRTVQAREEERVRVAADLHDGPIQRLAGLGYMVEVARLRIERADTAGGQKLLDNLREQIGTEVEALRQLMADLRPPVLDEWGLSAALTAYASQFERHTGISCPLEVRMGRRLDNSQETVLYRVTQEALANVRKHADAGTARITLTGDDSTVELRIVDDGVGFDVASMPDLLHRAHYGLAGMRQRVEMAGGTCAVRSRPGEGTTVTVTLPR